MSGGAVSSAFSLLPTAAYPASYTTTATITTPLRLFHGIVSSCHAPPQSFYVLRKSPCHSPKKPFPHAHMGFPACRKSLFHTSEKAFRPHIYYNILIFTTLQNCPKTRIFRDKTYVVTIHAILSDFTFHSHSPFLHTFPPSHFPTFSPSHLLTFPPLPHFYSYLPQVLVSRRIAYHQYVFARNDAHGVRLLIPKLERAARQSYAYVG